MAKAKRALWERLSWPQVAALAVLVAGVIGMLVAVPQAKLDALPWQQIGGLLAVLLGGSASSMLGPLFRRDDSARERDGERPSSTEGSAALELLAWLACAAVLVLAAGSLLGCGASALRTHATIASAVGAVLDTACLEVNTGRSAASDACRAASSADAEAGCVASVRERYEAPLAGCELAADVHDDWCAGLVQAEASGDFTLADGLPWVVRVIEVAGDLVRLLEAVGVDVDLPPELAALLGTEVVPSTRH